jgi:hypothetical protein
MQPIVEIHEMVAALGGAHGAMSWSLRSGCPVAESSSAEAYWRFSSNQ